MSKPNNQNASCAPGMPSYEFASGSEMEAVLRAKDWSNSALGPIENWPPSLRTAVSIVMSSQNPMFLAWSASLTFLFNDAYRPILGKNAAEVAKLFGRSLADALVPIWQDIRPLVDDALAGKPAWSEDLRLMIETDGVTEEKYFRFSCSPVQDESGNIAGVLGLCIDDTEKVLVQRRLSKSDEKLQLVTEAAELGLFDHDLQTGEIHWDWRTKQHFGLPPDAEVTPDTLFEGLHPDDREHVRQMIGALYNKENGHRYQIEHRTVGLADGKERWVAARGQIYFDVDGKPRRLVGTTMDITDHKLAEKRLQEAAQHDSLTGLPNRALLFEYCEHMFAQAERAGANSAVLFIDLDRFKPINDLYGHEVGDKVLKEVAHRLRICTRREDIVSRLGGDEFIVVLPRIHSREDPETVAQHILERIGEPFYIDTLQLHVSPSIGISLFQSHARDLETLIRYADLAMYSAKQSGRNSYKIYTEGLDERASDRLRLEIRLRESLAANRMSLVYQPILDIQTGELIGAEALIRLPAEENVFLSPEDFIPVAESAGLINQLGNWVASEACRQHQRWRAAGLPPLSIAINVSPVQFRQREFASQLSQAITQSGIDPACVQIEVTESAVINNLAEAISTLNEIRSMGVRIALDDFGTGYSSLSYLSSLPLDKLKIDQSFISRLESHAPTRSITEAVIALGQSLNLKVVGEGIESEEAVEYLRDHGCDQAQGFLFSKPLPAAEFEMWCRNHISMQMH